MNTAQKKSTLTPQEVADIFKKSNKWVYKYAADLNGSYIGGSLFFTQEGINDAIQRGQEVARGRNGRGEAIHKVTSEKKRRNGVGAHQKEITDGAKHHNLINAVC